MKIDNFFRGVSGVYLISIDEHQYIGSSVDIYNRLMHHRSALRSQKHDNKFMQIVYDKYTEEKMTAILLEKTEIEKRIEREAYYINKINPNLNLRLDPVTQNNCISTSKKVYQYDLEGEYIKEYISVSEAKRITGINGITHVANANYKHYKSIGGYRWSYEKVEKLEKYQNNSAKSKIKSITMYDISGKKIKTYESIASCYRENFTHFDLDKTCATISCCLKNKQIYFEDFRFSFENVEQLDNTCLLKFRKNFPISQYDKNQNLIKIWKNWTEVKKEYKTTYNFERIKNKRYLGFFWIRLGGELRNSVNLGKPIVK